MTNNNGFISYDEATGLLLRVMSLTGCPIPLVDVVQRGGVFFGKPEGSEHFMIELGTPVRGAGIADACAERYWRTLSANQQTAIRARALNPEYGEAIDLTVFLPTTKFEDA